MPEREISIFVAIPNMGEVVLGLALRCLKWATDRRFKTTFYTPQGVRPIPKVRNLIAREFLKSGFTHLMMVDADIVPPENVLDLALMGLDVVGALCPARQGGRTLYIALKSVPNSLYLEVISPLPPSQLVEVDATGCGCLFVRREVFERIEKPYFEYLRVDEEGLEFAGEDFNFCRKVRGAGFKIYVHTGYICEHWHKVDLRDSLIVPSSKPPQRVSAGELLALVGGKD